MSKKNKGGKIISVDFTGVETKQVIPDGDYTVSVKDIEEEKGDAGPYLNWLLDVTIGEFKGKRLYYITSLSKKSLWNLRAVLEALGIDVPKGKMQLNIKSYKGLEMGVTVESEKYQGKLKNAVVDIYNLEESSEKDDEDYDLEEMDLEELIAYAQENEISLTKKQKKNKKSALAAIQEAEEEEEPEEAVEEKPEEEPEEEDLEEMDLEELIAYAKENEIDLTAKQKKSKSKALKAIEEAEEEE